MCIRDRPKSTPGYLIRLFIGAQYYFVCVACSVAAAQSVVFGRVVSEYWRVKSHRLQHTIRLQDAHDHLSRHCPCCHHAFTMDYRKLDFACLRKVSVTLFLRVHVSSERNTLTTTTNKLEKHSQQRPVGLLYKKWGSPERTQRWQLLTDTYGVAVWLNVST